MEAFAKYFSYNSIFHRDECYIPNIKMTENPYKVNEDTFIELTNFVTVWLKLSQRDLHEKSFNT